MRQAHILGQEIVGAQAQPGHGVQFAVPGGEKDDGQFGRERAEVAAQIETAFRLVLERNVDDGQIGRRVWNACMASCGCRRFLIE